MAQKEKVYSQVTDAEDIVKNLCKQYPEELWTVRPETIAVLGVENKKRGKKSTTLARIIPVKGAEKAVFQSFSVPVRYIIELYWNDWNEWCMAVKEWIIYHELLHVAPDFGKTVKHDSEDFRMVLDVVGVDWTKKGDSLPRLLDGDKVKFNLDLRPSLAEAEEGDEIPQDQEADEETEAEPKEDAEELF